MSAPAGGLSVRRHGDVAVVAFTGELDVAAAAAVRKAAAEAIAGEPAAVIDLSRASYLDSGGVRLLDELLRQCRAREAPLRVVAGEAGSARTVLEICAFPPELLCSSVAAALDALRAGP